MRANIERKIVQFTINLIRKAKQLTYLQTLMRTRVTSEEQFPEFCAAIGGDHDTNVSAGDHQVKI